MNTYWNGQGNFQAELNVINEKMVDWGMTTNPLMNLFITCNKVYYDVYNNGGFNLDDMMHSIEEYIKPYASEFTKLRFDVQPKTLIRNLKNEVKLEKFFDDMILYVKDKDLSFKVYTLYYDYRKELLSETEQPGFFNITFGLVEECEDWKKHRLERMGYKMI